MVFHQFHPGTQGLHFRFSCFHGSAFIPVSPVKHANMGIFQNPAGIFPVVEGQEHICSHQQHQLRIRMLLLHLLHRFPCVAGAFPLKFQIRHFDLWAVRKRNLKHFKPLLRCGRTLRDHLMRRNPVRDYQKLCQLQSRNRLPCSLNMPNMGRIKGAAVNTDTLHINLHSLS